MLSLAMDGGAARGAAARLAVPPSTLAAVANAFVVAMAELVNDLVDSADRKLSALAGKLDEVESRVCTLEARLPAEAEAGASAATAAATATARSGTSHRPGWTKTRS